MNCKGFVRKRSVLIEVLSRHSPGGTEETTKTSVRIAGLLAEIRTRYLPNRTQECQPFDQDVRSLII
jgi:hypothetical protein